MSMRTHKLLCIRHKSPCKQSLKSGTPMFMFWWTGKNGESLRMLILSSIMYTVTFKLNGRICHFTKLQIRLFNTKATRWWCSYHNYAGCGNDRVRHPSTFGRRSTRGETWLHLNFWRSRWSWSRLLLPSSRPSLVILSGCWSHQGGADRHKQLCPLWFLSWETAERAHCWALAGWLAGLQAADRSNCRAHQMSMSAWRCIWIVTTPPPSTYIEQMSDQWWDSIVHGGLALVQHQASTGSMSFACRGIPPLSPSLSTRAPPNPSHSHNHTS